MKIIITIVCIIVALVSTVVFIETYAYENTVVFPTHEDNDFEYGTYTTHDNATGENETGSYIYQKPEKQEEPRDIYFEEKWEEMKEDAGVDEWEEE